MAIWAGVESIPRPKPWSFLPLPSSLFPFFYRQLRQMKYLSTGSPVCLAQYSREARGAM